MGTVIAMVRAGMGHAIIPSFALEECKRHGLQISMLKKPVAHLDLYLVSRRGNRPKTSSVDFATLLKMAAVKLASTTPDTSIKLK
jgi:DNA-binding transcriptional LysR family regulator